jgi:16S rRNA (cytosine967-C5)-methyltransferase
MKQRRISSGGPSRASACTSGRDGTSPAAPGLPARRAALAILLRVERQRAFADVLLGHRLGAFAPADRRLVTQLVLGTIAWQGRLDYELARIASRALSDIAPEVAAILRMALYQIRLLSRVPHHAAVDTAVSLAHETAGGTGAARFVNAVLRNAIRSPVPLPQRSADEIEYLAVAYSHPRWMVEKFVSWFGARDCEALLAADNEAAPTVLRLNLERGGPDELTARLEHEGMRVARRGRFAETLVLDGAPNFDSGAYRNGLFQPQSEASQMVSRLLAPTRGATVVDCAAAPGGKATHLAAMVGASGRVVAFDINFTGLKNARALARRLGCGNVEFVRCEGTFALPLRRGSIAYLLLDAPCTGLGTLREHPEIRWRLEPAEIQRMTAIQTRMLECAAEVLRPGGVLVYSVCSIAPDEGEEVVRNFLARHLQFELDRDPPHRSELANILDDQGCMRTRPDRDGLNGFFAARLKRLA